MVPTRAVLATLGLALAFPALAIPQSSVPVPPPEVAPATAVGELAGCTPRPSPGELLCACGPFGPGDFATAGSTAGHVLTLDGVPAGPPEAVEDGVAWLRLPPATAPGRHEVGLDTSQVGCSFEVIAVRAVLDRQRLLRGGRTELELTIEGTAEPVELRLVNRSPAVVRLEGGDDQRTGTSGGTPNLLRRTVHALGRGDFDIGWELLGDRCPCAPASGPPEAETATGGPPEAETTRGEPPEAETTPGEPGDRGPTVTYGDFKDCATGPAEEPATGHPFDPLAVDPVGPRTEHPLATAVRQAESDLREWRRLCEQSPEDAEIARSNVEVYHELLRRLEATARSLGIELAGACTDSGCCEGPCCAGLDPASAADRARLRQRRECLVDRLVRLKSQAEAAGYDAHRLVERWRSGEGHREGMAMWADFYGLIADAIAAAGELIDQVAAVLPAAQLEELENRLVDELGGAACRALGFSEEECRLAAETIEQAESLKEAFEGLTAMAKSGSLSPAFTVRMIDAMAAAAGSAARVAVDGWEQHRREMNAAIAGHHGLLLCGRAVADELRRLAEDCPPLCAAAEASLAADLEAARTALAEHRARQAEARARARQAEEALIDGAIGEAFGDDDWKHACCADRSGTLQLDVERGPGDDRCLRLLDARLRAALGPKLCHLRGLVVTVRCARPWNHSEVAWSSYSLEAEPRPGCCLRPVEPPPPGGEPEPLPREPRPVRPPARTEPPPDDPPTPQRPPVRLPPACTCRLDILLRGAPVAGAAPPIVPAGTPGLLSARGDCAPCSATGLDWRVVPPPATFAGLSVPRAAVAATGSPLAFDFPDPGLYQVELAQTCSDGSSCRASTEVRVDPRDEDVAPPREAGEDEEERACGAAPCLDLAAEQGDGVLRAAAAVLRLDAGGEVVLVLAASCLPAGTPRTVGWEIVDPNGAVTVRRGRDLDRLPHDLPSPGVYRVCVTESAGPGAALSRSFEVVVP